MNMEMVTMEGRVLTEAAKTIRLGWSFFQITAWVFVFYKWRIATAVAVSLGITISGGARKEAVHLPTFGHRFVYSCKALKPWSLLVAKRS